MSRAPRVLFLCTGNSCRSQMAEGLARARWGGSIEVMSAGTRPHGLNRLAVIAMDELNIDLSHHTSKTIGSLAARPMDLVVTVCNSARAACPVFPGATKTVHQPFDDPPALAAAARTDAEALPHYRRVRDEIRAFIETLPDLLPPHPADRRPERNIAMTTNDTAPKAASNSAPCCAPGCCTPAAASPTTADIIREQVREGYGKIAEAGSWSATKHAASGGCCAPSASGASGGGCCGPSTFTSEELARAIGYSQAELSGAAGDANLGLSCGNPTAIASLREGETVLDLGSGAGFDAFIAGPKVGAMGRVIGVDMTPAMVTKARANIATYTAQTGLRNIEFKLGEIESIPLPDASVDVVISNCVLNLSPDQEAVWREIARVLRPGGRVAISDLVLLRALPAAVRTDIEALVGCVAGASLMATIEGMARRAGLKDVRVERKGGYVDAMTDWQDPLYQKIIAALGPNEKIGNFVASADITAVKG